QTLPLAIEVPFGSRKDGETPRIIGTAGVEVNRFCRRKARRGNDDGTMTIVWVHDDRGGLLTRCVRPRAEAEAPGISSRLACPPRPSACRRGSGGGTPGGTCRGRACPQTGARGRGASPWRPSSRA